MEKFTSPSPEDDKQAENMMTDTEKILSESRDLHRIALEKLGHTGHLYFSEAESKTDFKIEGVIDGTPITLLAVNPFKQDGFSDPSFTGSVEVEVIPGKRERVALEPHQAESLWKKFDEAQRLTNSRGINIRVPFAEHKELEEDRIKKAQSEREAGYQQVREPVRDEVVERLLK